MLGMLKSLGQAVSSLGHAVGEGIRAVATNFRIRKLHADFDKRLRGEIAANKCANCSALVGPKPFRDHDVPGRYYCSFDCLNTALIKRDSELDEKTARQPAALGDDDQALLVGKSSPGMYYEPGRCIQCGDVLRDAGAIFGFCSATCEERATKPYMTFTQQLADTDEYMKAARDRQDFARKEPEIIEEVKMRCEKKTMTDDEIQTYLDRQLKLAELIYNRRKSFDHGEARVSFLKKWELQRGYVLEQEKRKEARPQDGGL
jgi:ferredoxin